MKFRLFRITLLSIASFTLFGCNNTKDIIDSDGNNTDNKDNNDDNNNDENFDFEEDKPSDMTDYYTIRFDSNGGTKIKNQYVKKDELVSEPVAPTNKDLVFGGWYLTNKFIKKFDFNTKITTDYFLFAKWNEKDDGGDVVPPDGDKTNHSPDGATLVEWYLVGSGSLFTKEWSVEGGVQLYSNPIGTDLACILNLTIEEGDLFKIKDGGSTWIGYSAVDSYDDSSNLGLNNFSSDSDGNFVCNVTASYNIYLNEKDGNKSVWIAGAN